MLAKQGSLPPLDVPEGRYPLYAGRVRTFNHIRAISVALGPGARWSGIVHDRPRWSDKSMLGNHYQVFFSRASSRNCAFKVWDLCVQAASRALSITRSLNNIVMEVCDFNLRYSTQTSIEGTLMDY